ncbi:MFS transporter [Natrialba swarupiae]|uniref:MFS transporter n=1 Tax=Natrialba swarupiae TaxID=2448032 RepID=A0A5D5AQ46_9EURY|nr:MFS transporter [Natrialba swarupiae]TYT63978.1 MFS transporter [Natrialba swarupiae]
MSDRPTAGRNASTLFVLIAFVLAALNLRPAIASVPPVLEVIRADLALSYTAVSLLTTIPMFCMGLFAFLTPRIAQYGRERGLFWAIVLVGLATAARIAGDSVAILFVTTIVVGIAIAVGQTLLPALVNEYFPDRAAFATGVYSISLAVGATLAAGLTVPVYQIGGSWTLALASWAVLAVAAAVVLVPLVRGSRSDSGNGVDAPQRLPWRTPIAWAVTLFFVCASTIFYSGLTWLAPRYVALGWDESTAGFLLTTFTLTQVVGMGLFMLFGDRISDRRPWIFGMGSVTAASLVAIAVAPSTYPWLLVAVLGSGSGGLFTIALTLPIDLAADGSTTDRLATMGMGIGYMVAAIGPSVVGGIRDVTGSYVPAFVALGTVGVFMIALGVAFRPGNDGAVGA